MSIGPGISGLRVLFLVVENSRRGVDVDRRGRHRVSWILVLGPSMRA